MAATDTLPLLLIIEDDRDVLELYMAAFGSPSLSIATFRDGAPALEWAQQTNRAPSMIISDFHLIHSTADEFLPQLRQLFPNTFILVCAECSSEEKEKISQSFNDIVRKPVEIMRLIKLVVKHCSPSSSTDQS